MGGDNVRRVPTFCDNTVNAVGRTDVLPEQPDGGLRHRQRVGGVNPPLREGRSMRLLAGVADLEVGSGDNGQLDHVRGGRVHHHGGIDARKCAALEEEDFAPTTFLGRRTDHADC